MFAYADGAFAYANAPRGGVSPYQPARSAVSGIFPLRLCWLIATVESNLRSSVAERTSWNRLTPSRKAVVGDVRRFVYPYRVQQSRHVGI